MNDLLIPWLAGVALLAVAAAWWLRYLARRRAAHRRIQGYRLIRALQAYSAWFEARRDLPFAASSLDELTSPAPLTRAREIKHRWFPALSQPMLRLLQAHSRVVEYLWEQHLLRLTQGAGWQPASQDAQYQQLRGAQEDLIDEMIELCRELIGDTRRPWRRTGSDFSFSNGLGISGPASRA